METTEKFDSWGLLELFGHQRLAGRITDATIGGLHFLRIDVPQVGDVAPYTRFFGQGAVYALTPMSEDVARRLADRLRAAPVMAYELPPVPEAITNSRRDDDDVVDADFDPDSDDCPM